MRLELPAALAEWAADVEAVPARDVYSLLMVDVPRSRWHEALASARDRGGMARLEFMTAVDEEQGSFTIVAQLLGGSAAVDGAVPEDLVSLFVRTRLGPDDVLESVADVFAGAAWHEREMAEMFGVALSSGEQERLLLAEGLPSRPMLKSFWLEPRQDRAWPGAKEPGESDADAAAGADSTDGERPRRSRRRQTTFGIKPDDDQRGAR